MTKVEQVIFPNRLRKFHRHPIKEALYGARPKEHWVVRVTTRNGTGTATCACGYELHSKYSRLTAKRFDAHWIANPKPKVNWQKEAKRLQDLLDESKSKYDLLFIRYRVVRSELSQLCSLNTKR